MLTFKRFIKPVAWILAGLIVLAAVSSVVGFWMAPGWVKSKIEQSIPEKLERKLSVEKVDINLLTLSVSLEGVKLTEPKSDAIFASFDKLELDVSLQSIFRMEPVIRNVQLVNPYVHLIRTKENQYNFSDLLALTNNNEPKADKGKAQFAIHNIQIEGGRINFEDLPKNKKHLVENLKLGIPFISTISSDVETTVDLLLSAKINGTPFEFSAEMKPFAEQREMTARVQLTGIDLPGYMGYLPAQPNFKLQKGKLNTDLLLHFVQPENKSPQLLVSGKLHLDSLVITELDKTPLLSLRGLNVSLEKSPVLTDQYQIAKIELLQPEVSANRSRNGEWNLSRLSFAEQKSGQKSEQKSTMHLSLQQLSIKDGKINYQDRSLPFFISASVEKWNLAVDNTMVDMKKNEVGIGKISSSSANIDVVNRPWKRSGDRKNRPENKEKYASKDKSSASGKRNPSPDLTVNVGKLAISGWDITHENQKLSQPIKTKIDSLSVTLDNFSTLPEHVSKLAISAKVNNDKSGQIAVGGDVGLSPLLLKLSLDLKNVDIRAAQSYIDEYVNLVVKRAGLSAKGILQLAQDPKKGFEGEYKGNLSIDDVATTDQITGKGFAGWKKLSIKGINAQFSPLSISVKYVGLQDFMARIILNPEGRLNLQDILRSHAGGKKSLTEEHPQSNKSAVAEKVAVVKSDTASAGNSGKEKGLTEEHPQSNKPAAVEEVAVAKSDTAPAENSDKETGSAEHKDNSDEAPAGQEKSRVNIPIHINKIKMSRGSVRFTDNYIKPNYTAKLLDLNGTVMGLSSNQDSKAQIDMRGQVNGAPLTIAGTVNPFRENLFLDLQAHVKGMDLTQLSSYSTKYAGYGIEKGKLSFDVSYLLDGRALKAENRLILDQLTFGGKVESPTATKLPVLLAVSLLKDRDGVIDVHLPVSGSLDDPEFSVGGIVFRLIGNLITKIVTSPFSLLSSIGGGSGEKELSWLEFDAGSKAIPESGIKQLGVMAKALQDRPGLKLEIAGRFDPVADKQGLAQASIDRKVRALKRSDLEAKGQTVSLSQVTVEKDEYPSLLARAYRSEKGHGLTGYVLSTERMEKNMLAEYKADENDFIQLGNQRAEAVRDWLVKQGQISADRIFILASKDGSGKEGVRASRVDFSLR